MARSKRRSTAQRVVGLALTGMPAPVRNVAASRRGAPLLLLLVTGLLVSGLITITWSNGLPKVSLDRQRAGQVKEAVAERVESAKERWTDAGGQGGILDALGGLVGPTAPSPDAPPAANVPSTPAPAPAAPPPAAPLAGPATYPVAATPRPTVLIASFNIQVFGTSKLQKTPVMAVLADIVRRFDVVAIQEVRSTDDTVVPQFVTLINSAGRAYDFVIGPRLGRTNSKEQYAILFDTTRIEVDPRSVYTVPDPQDFLHREPLVARFRVRGVPPNQAFTFTIVDIHTDPDETDTELNALGDVFVSVQRNGTGEDDVILLGDLNVDEYHLGNLGRLPGIGYAISGVPTNTRRNKTYDNIVFDRRTTVEYTGRSGVLDMMTAYGLSEDQALEVSDHLPVWAEFSAYEGWSGGPIAQQPGGYAR